MWQDKDLLLLMNYTRNIFCTLRSTKTDPAIRRAQEFQERFYFPVLGTVRGRHTHCVLREASSVQDEWKSKAVIGSITCIQRCLRSFWMPLLVLLLKLWRVIFTDIPLSPSEVCAGTYSSQHILIVVCMGRIFGQGGFFRAVCPARPYPAAPSLGLFGAWASKHYVSPSFCSGPQRGPDKFDSLFRSTLETIVWVAVSWRCRLLIREVFWFPACSVLFVTTINNRLYLRATLGEQIS